MAVTVFGLVQGQAQAADPSVSGSGYVETAVIKVPTHGGPLFGDIIFADRSSGLVYFSDLTNSSLDVIDSHTPATCQANSGIHQRARRGGASILLDTCGLGTATEPLSLRKPAPRSRSWAR